MRKFKLSFLILLICLMVVSVGCSTGTTLNSEDISEEVSNDNLDNPDEEKYTVIGFSQLGAESDWRSANTQSMIETFTEENGYKLLFEDGQQKQSNQMIAIRKFIQQDVDYIVLAPVTEVGWDNVLLEAKQAGIPVIIMDRMVDVSDDSLYTCWVGSNFELESLKLCEWINQYCKKKFINQSKLHIVNLQGSLGSSAQIGRTEGLRKSAEMNGWDILEETPAEFTRTKGKEAMKSLLKKYNNINLVYCENDNEALGAIEALEEAGKTVGPDINHGEIMVVSFDGVNNEARKLVVENKISCIGECNPDLGPRVETIIKSLKAGKKPQKHSYIGEDIFAHDSTVGKIRVNAIEYGVTILKK